MKKRITIEAIRQYAEASRDSAAIHLDPEAAKNAGFTHPIAHGMYIMGIAHSMYLSKHPTHWITSSQMTFLRPLVSDTTVQVHFDPMGDEVQVTVAGEDGEIATRGCFLAEGGLDHA